jgi:hypothetical protein
MLDGYVTHGSPLWIKTMRGIKRPTRPPGTYKQHPPHSSSDLRSPPFRIISTLHLQIVARNRRLQASIHNELGPINSKPAAHGLLMRSRDRKVRWLLMQQEDIAMCWRCAGGRCRTEVA